MFNVGEMFADFTLPSTTGSVIQYSDFRQHQNVVVLLPSVFAEQLLTELCAHEEALSNLNAVILCLARDRQIPLLQRTAGNSQLFKFLIINKATTQADRVPGPRQTESETSPWVYILDRYGEIYARLPEGGQSSPVSASAILE